MSTTVLRAKALSTGYRQKKREWYAVSRNLELGFRGGEVCALIGPNGAGKSTLLRTLAGLQAPMRGEILLHEEPLVRYSRLKLARSLAVVLTGRLHTGRMKCRSLVSLARYPYTGWLSRGGAEDEEAVERAMDAVGMADLAEAGADELSDGEFEKVMIARALAQEPEVMLLDEPAAFLDFARRVELMHLLHRLSRERGMAVLVTSHDLDLVLRSADRVVLLSGGGTAADGAPEDLVLSGALERVFSSPLVYFDLEEGSFRARSERAREEVGLYGRGHLRHWTARALLRLGYEPLQPSDMKQRDNRRTIRVTEGKDGPHWELELHFRGEPQHGAVRHCSSLYQLLQELSRGCYMSSSGDKRIR